MNCQQIDKYLFAYCDNDLSPDLREKIAKHVRNCERCRAEVAVSLKENELLKDTSDIPALADDFTPRIIQLLSAREISTGEKYQEIKTAPQSAKRKFLILCASAAALVLLVFLVPGILNQEEVNIADRESANQSQVIDKTESNRQLNTLSLHNQEIEREKTVSKSQPAESIPEDLGQGNDKNQDIKASAPTEDAAPSSPSTTVKQSPMSICSALDEQAKDITAADMPYLQPANMPDGFQLSEVISLTTDEYTFVYDDIKQTKHLEITISDFTKEKLAKNNSVDTVGNQEEQSDRVIEMAEENYAVLADGLTYNSAHSVISSGGKRYQVILRGNIPQEELASIAEKIMIKETSSHDDDK